MSQLRELKITLWADGEQLGCRQRNPDPQLTQELSARKADILRYLKQAESLTTAEESGITRVPRDQRSSSPLANNACGFWIASKALQPRTMPLAVRLNGTLHIKR
jgi:hypothetical protein